MPNSHFGSPSPTSSTDTDLLSSADSSSIVGFRHRMDSTSSHPIASVEVLRCMRCARAVEATSTDDLNNIGMVRIAQNLYYCQRCAKMVGYK
ncbi:hypothetical protein CDD82_7553 [Ophiocordyceps australis]|uniref:Uncharacterized protein n=1 Tax=Ophiocordyceps australis TaxID=1399860 RepID=A0A2C5YLR9_9HYPO|nr:hypothetical protein CDD82_7553 [Ophiocordyceps australis]